MLVVMFIAGWMLGSLCYRLACWMSQVAYSKGGHLGGGLLLAMVFVAVVHQYGVGWEGILWCVLACLFLVVAIIDAQCCWIPDSLLVLAVLTYGCLQLYTVLGQSDAVILFFAGLQQSLLQGCAVSLPLLVFVLVADWLLGRPTMGWGDVKLVFVIGLWLGSIQAWLTLWLASMLGLVVCLVRKQGREMQMPFGPWLVVSFWIMMAWGNQIQCDLGWCW